MPQMSSLLLVKERGAVRKNKEWKRMRADSNTGFAAMLSAGLYTAASNEKLLVRCGVNFILMGSQTSHPMRPSQAKTSRGKPPNIEHVVDHRARDDFDVLFHQPSEVASISSKNAIETNDFDGVGFE